MPFPLAHPAAVLPLRRYCPRRLSFLALVIGSLTPDLGYAFEHLHVALFSHRLLAGSFGFCLPAGLVLVAAIYALRRPMVGILPARYRRAIWPLCERPAGSPVRIALSLLIGAWTHILLDSITHADGWLVEHLAILRSALPWIGGRRLAVYAVLYAGTTFLGVAWLALVGLRWLEARDPSSLSKRRTMWGWALLLASGILLTAEASRGPRQVIGILPAGIIAIVLLAGFVVGTGRNLAASTRDAASRNPESPGHPPESP
jgi:hypothetical protein